MADQKITGLTALTTPSDDDVLALVDDPAGTPITKKITYANLKAAIRDYNTTNLKITSDQLNTIQDIATSSSPTFASPIFTGNPVVSMGAASNGGLYFRDTSLTNGGATPNGVNKFWIAQNTTSDSIYIYHYNDDNTYDWGVLWLDENGNMLIPGSLGLQGQSEMRLYDSDSSNYVGFKSPATVSANKVWTLPSADGSAGQILKTDGSATLSWTRGTNSVYQNDSCTGDVALNNVSNWFDITGISISQTLDFASTVKFYIQFYVTPGGGGGYYQFRIKNSTDTTYSTELRVRNPASGSGYSGQLTGQGMAYLTGETAGAKTYILQAKANDTAATVKATDTWVVLDDISPS